MMLFMIMLLLGMYMYFVSASVVHVIVRKEIDQDITRVSSKLSDLEASFITAKQAIDEDTITRHGFVFSHDSKTYITKAPSSLVLATGDEI